MKRSILSTTLHWFPLPLGFLLVFLLFFFRENLFLPVHWGASTLLAHKTLPLKGGSSLFSVTKIQKSQGVAIEIHKLPLSRAQSLSPALEARFFLYRHQDSFLEDQWGHYTNLVFFYDNKGSPPMIGVPTLNSKKKAQLTLYQWDSQKKDFQSSKASPDFYKKLKNPLLLGTEGAAP